MRHYWARSIRDRWLRLALLALAASGAAGGQTLEGLVRAYRLKPTPANEQALARFARAHPRDAQGAMALLALGSVKAQQEKYAPAAAYLKGTPPRLGALADYAGYWLGLSYAGQGQYGPAIAALEQVWTAAAGSPLAEKAVLLAAKAYTESGQPAGAIRLLKQHYRGLPRAEAEAALGRAHEAAGDGVSAALSWQRVYFQHPASGDAAEAGRALAGLESRLGPRYPPAMPQAILERAQKLLDAREYRQARKEFERAAPLLGGAERELARVRVGAADYHARETRVAYRYLADLQTAEEAGAERLYYLLACARRLEREDEFASLLEQLERKHPQSPWRLEALLWAGNHFLLANRQDRYEPIFRACAESFPTEPKAAYCHWKVTWAAWLRREPGAVDALRDHVRRYPQSEKTPAALYFLGRTAEEARDRAAAKAWYQAIQGHWPNHYYTMLARERSASGGLGDIQAAPAVEQFLRGAAFPERPRQLSFAATPKTKQRIERSRLLRGAGFDDWSESEMRFGAREDGQPQILAVELAQAAQRRGAPDQGIRYIKSLVPGYLSLPLDAAPASFWQLAFPLPYRASLEKHARAQSLDLFLLAGLIRQESEFNPGAVSPAKAYGLTQVLPSTGRSLSRKVGLGPFRPSMLTQVDANLKMGTYYLRALADSLNGKWEQTLAAYNGGKSRVLRWMEWGDYREAAEFIENIPITETRDYVQIVLRNANFYRRLYVPGGAVADGDPVDQGRLYQAPGLTLARRR